MECSFIRTQFTFYVFDFSVSVFHMQRLQHYKGQIAYGASSFSADAALGHATSWALQCMFCRDRVVHIFETFITKILVPAPHTSEGPYLQKEGIQKCEIDKREKGHIIDIHEVKVGIVLSTLPKSATGKQILHITPVTYFTMPQCVLWRPLIY